MVIGCVDVRRIYHDVGHAKSVRMHGPSEFGCAIPLALVTCWFGWLLLRELGVVQ